MSLLLASSCCIEIGLACCVDVLCTIVDRGAGCVFRLLFCSVHGCRNICVRRPLIKTKSLVSALSIFTHRSCRLVYCTPLISTPLPWNTTVPSIGVFSRTYYCTPSPCHLSHLKPVTAYYENEQVWLVWPCWMLAIPPNPLRR